MAGKKNYLQIINHPMSIFCSDNGLEQRAKHCVETYKNGILHSGKKHCKTITYSQLHSSTLLVL
ncbi:MAG: hypothetical protein COV66_04890 [Nitrospinae bacterium CG11_big_fil_rev_8_21_14_0_20_45_15]|nr:MAG: hypothetical protein COV66_04890 [Nitrospinae bacterium CG11_big_fil_rev_8_21_14_0_20_45_15]